jgi:DNA invertase Pin-like site-specific DNA recombinase
MGMSLRVVTYARVSTIKQETEGQSLDNQERAFQAWLRRTGSTRLHAYAESRSAKTIEGREQFMKMILDLRRLRPDLIVVDTIDRFSRNLRDGLDLLERFRTAGTALLPLDWDEPVDLSSDRDWRSVVQELTGADYERRRIRSRILKHYNARRARGATLHTKCPFGLRKDGDILVPIPELQSVMRGAERVFLMGGTREDVLKYVQKKAPDRAWKTHMGPRRFLRNPEYVKAGARTPEVQAQIDARLAYEKIKHPRNGRHDHRMARVFSCGLCVALGAPPERVAMHGKAQWSKILAWNDVAYGIVCPGSRHRRRYRMHRRTISANAGAAERVFIAILEYVSQLSDESLIEVRRHEHLESSWERRVQRHLADVEKIERNYRDRTVELIQSLEGADEGLKDVKDALGHLVRADNALSRHREGLLDDLSRGLASKKPRESEDWRAVVAKALEDWPELDFRHKSDFALAFCESMGSRPLLYKNLRWPHVMWVTWEEIAPGIVWCAKYGRPQKKTVELLRLFREG